MSDATVCPECGGAPWSTPNGCFCAQRKVLVHTFTVEEDDAQ